MARTVLITGCSSGFGRRAAEKFLTEGWNVAATLRDPQRWQGVQSDRLLVQPLDVRDEESIRTAIQATVERFGGLDSVVNNAGAGLLSVFEATPLEAMTDLFDTNVFGPMRVMQAALTVLGPGSRIVNVTSSSVPVPDPLMAAYAASKAALHNLSEGLSYELAQRDIDVAVVEPGYVPGTDFGANTTERSQPLPIPEQYAGYVDKRISLLLGEQPDGLATEQDVAEQIFTAATEDSGRFRYRVGADAVERATVRQQSDEEYDSWRLAYFA